jgi:DNA polymerase alpha subunit A
MNVYGKRCLNAGCRGQMTQEFNDKMVYNQLLYYDLLFDIEKAKKKAAEDDKGTALDNRTDLQILCSPWRNRIARDLISYAA